jgi:hypothetical protein
MKTPATLASLPLLVLAACASPAERRAPPAVAGAAVEAGPARAERPVDPAVARAQFERIKGLAGEWSGAFGEGAEAGTGETRFRVTAGGSTVEETLFPGTPHEMITMYHLDGGQLVLTHYCAAQNQPRMVARSGAADRDAKTIRFDFAGLGNGDPTRDGHMHEAEITIDGNSLKTAWTFYQDGKPAEVARFDLKRKEKPAARAEGASGSTLLGASWDRDGDGTIDGGVYDRIIVDKFAYERSRSAR